MQVKGILKKKVAENNGVSKSTGNPWRTDEWLLVIPGNGREKHIKVEVRGVERCDQWQRFFDGMPDKNAPVLVDFTIDAREYQGRWFNTVEAYNLAVTEW